MAKHMNSPAPVASARRGADLAAVAESIRYAVESTDRDDEDMALFVTSKVLLNLVKTTYELAAQNPPKLVAIARELADSGCGVTADKLWDMFVMALAKKGFNIPRTIAEAAAAAPDTEPSIPNSRSPRQASRPVTAALMHSVKAPAPQSRDDAAELPPQATDVPSATPTMGPDTEAAPSCSAKAPSKAGVVDLPPDPHCTPPIPGSKTAGESAKGKDHPSPFPEMRIDSIDVGDNRRTLGDLRSLMDSIRELDLLEPIVVTVDGRLVDGNHRLEACRELGMSTIRVRYLDLKGLYLELAEIDANLCRNELTFMERSEHIYRRKKIFESLHPETKHGGSPGKAGGGKVARAKTETVSSFATSTAGLAGLTARSVEQDVQIAKGIPQDVRDDLRDTPFADRKRDLLELSRLPPDQQRMIVDRLIYEDSKTFSGAKGIVCGEPGAPERPPKTVDPLPAQAPGVTDKTEVPLTGACTNSRTTIETSSDSTGSVPGTPSPVDATTPSDLVKGLFDCCAVLVDFAQVLEQRRNEVHGTPWTETETKAVVDAIMEGRPQIEASLQVMIGFSKQYQAAVCAASVGGPAAAVGGA